MATNEYVFQNMTGEQVEDALKLVIDKESEAFAIGTRGGVPVPPTDPAYHNNSKYYSEQASSAGESANIAASSAESAAQSASNANTDAQRAEDAANRAESIADAEFVSYGFEQNLTNEQKERARRNMGALGELVMDSSPVQGSNNAVTSGGIFNAIDSAFANLNTSKAPKVSPAFTGTPTAPTPATTVNNTQIATTAFVHKAVSGYGPQWHEITNLSYSNAQVTALLLNNSFFGGVGDTNSYPMRYVKLNYFDIDSQVGGIDNVKAFRFRMDNLRFSAGYIGTSYNGQSSSYTPQIAIHFSPLSYNSYYESIRLNNLNGRVNVDNTYFNFWHGESAFRTQSLEHPKLWARANTLNNATLALNSLYTRNDSYNFIEWTQYLNFANAENIRVERTYASSSSKEARFISPRAFNESSSFSFPLNGAYNFFIVPFLSQTYQSIPGQMNNVRINGRFVFEALY